LFRKLNLQGWQLGGDSGFGHSILDRMAEQGYHLKRFDNGSPAKQPEIFFNLSAEQWSTVGQLIERKQIIIPNDEKLIAQLTSRRKLYDSKGRERLESKADLASGEVESPDQADALIGAVMMRISSDPYAFDPAGKQTLLESLQQINRRMERDRSPFHEPYVDWSKL
jgi:hypothetical protein